MKATVQDTMLRSINRNAPTVGRWLDLGVSWSVVSHWFRQDMAALESATKVVIAHGGNPWVFIAADEAHFEQFANEPERRALEAMTTAQAKALCYWM